MSLYALVIRPILFVLALATMPAVAQPTADALLDAWLSEWDAAAERLASVELGETQTRTVEGPRGTLEIETMGTLVLYPEGRPRRSVASATVNGEPLELEKRSHMERRLSRALGPASMDLRRPAPLPIRILATSEPLGAVERTRLGTTLAWQMSLARPSRRGPPERLTAWFTTSSTEPRLLQLQRDRRLRHQDTLTRVTTYTRVDGLDLPVRHTVDAQIEQRRRLRTYTLTLRSDARYSMPRIEQ